MVNTCTSIGLLTALAGLLSLLAVTTSSKIIEGSGCADGSSEGLEHHGKVAACEGEWAGHVQNSSYLCARGWRVCGWYDEHVLKTITWKDAMSVEGCFAFNAAQDGGECKECRSFLEEDDLAGIGRGCPHQSYGQKSCISGGKIDVSCCVDTHFNRACTYRPGLANGVLCCRLPGVPPRILVHPEKRKHVTTEHTFLLTCQATGTPPPRVTWYKDGKLLYKNNTQIHLSEAGYLLVSQAKPSDSGIYTCMMTNSEGNDTSSSKVVVADYRSGCSDGTTDGLHQFEDIQACKGKWRGHVKRAKQLCSRGWLVCSPHHVDLIRQITWADNLNLKGCYAYNSENTQDKCTRCHRRNMAGVGDRCSKMRRLHSSCLAQGRVDVYHDEADPGCTYKQGSTTGVLCCRKVKSKSKYYVYKQGSTTGVLCCRKVKSKKMYKPKSCSPKCQNGGRCTWGNTCRCAPGYKGAFCQHAVCEPSCGGNSFCVRPGACRCRPGYVGHHCMEKISRKGNSAQQITNCKRKCYNGGRCKNGHCKCPRTHWGLSCQHLVRWRPNPELNRTER